MAAYLNDVAITILEVKRIGRAVRGHFQVAAAQASSLQDCLETDGQAYYRGAMDDQGQPRYVEVPVLLRKLEPQGQHYQGLFFAAAEPRDCPPD